MNVTYIHHSGFLVETGRAYYLFDYETGELPPIDPQKPIFVLSSHSHGDHYNPEIFPLLARLGIAQVQAVLSDDIPAPEGIPALMVSPGQTHCLGPGQRLTTFRSTDLGVAFLLETEEGLIYHAGDLNDWVWAEETDHYNRQMTLDYQEQIGLLKQHVKGREIDLAFVVLDPRQEADYHRGLYHFLSQVTAKNVYPMHYWDDPSVIERFKSDHPEFAPRIQKTQ